MKPAVGELEIVFEQSIPDAEFPPSRFFSVRGFITRDGHRADLSVSGHRPLDEPFQESLQLMINTVFDMRPVFRERYFR